MIAEIIWTKPALRILRVMLKGGEFTYYSANELAERTGLSTPTVIETLNGLISLNIVQRVKATRKRYYFRITPLNPVTPLIEEILDLVMKLEDRIIAMPLRHIDEVLGEEYYVGMYWAAMANITPIDYSPRIYAVYTKKPQWLLPLKASERIYVETEEYWDPKPNKEVYIAVIPVKEFPYDLTVADIQGEEARVASIERGIAQTFKARIYPPYAATLALLQNKDMNRIDEEKMERVATEEGSLPIIKAVAWLAERILEGQIFDKLSKDVEKTDQKPKIVWGPEPTITLKTMGTVVAIDPKPIEDAVTAVYG